MAAGDLNEALDEQLSTSRTEEAYWLGMLAFRYAFPILEMQRARWQWHFDRSAPSYLGAINEIHHTTRRAGPADTYFVTPLVDAPYSRCFCDLAVEPYVLSVPAIDDRYFTVQLLDFHTNSFAYVGSRLGDTAGGDFLVAGPGWGGEAPDGIERVIIAPTPVVCLLARVTIVDDDVEAAVALQTQIGLTSLSRFGGDADGQDNAHAPPPGPPPEYRDYRTGDPLDFFRMLAECLTENPPPARDAGVLGMIARIGIAPGREFDPEALHPSALQGLRRAIPAGLQSLYAELPVMAEQRNGWLMPDPQVVGDYGTDYYTRAEIAAIGLLANAGEESYYVGTWVDGDGEPLVGDRSYVLRFEPGGLPPVEAFWSVTAYLNPEGWLIENEAGRHALGSLSQEMRYGEDGSLEIWIQRDRPDDGRESNWLPCAEPGRLFRLILRLYVPRADALGRRWEPPAVRRPAR